MSALDWLIRTSWQSAVLALAILVLQRALGRRLDPRWRVALWWLVVLRLVLPPISLPGVDVTGEMPWEAAAAPVESVAPVLPSPELEAAKAPFVPPVEAPPVPAPVSLPAVAPAPAPVVVASELPSLPETAILVWLAVAAGLVVVSAVTGVSTVRRLKRGRILDDPDLRRLVAECAREAGIRRRITARESRDVEVPTLIGIFSPRLLLPASALRELTAAELRYVIHHELEHVRHHDLAVNWLLHAVACLHWMNPFAWLAVGRLRTERETVRDLGVLRRTPGTTGREFGRTILRILSFAARVPRAPAHVALLEPGRDLKRRIAMLAVFDRPRRGRFLLGSLLVLLLVTGAALLASEPSTVVAEEGKDAGPAESDSARPRVLVTSFSSTGDLLEKEKNLDRSLETLAEAILAETRATVSAADLTKACRRLGCRPHDLVGSADLRLEVSKLLGARQCLTGWACSFGQRVVLVLETIDVGKGLPGTVRRVTCDGLEGIPDAMKELLGDLPAPSAKPETREPAADPVRADLADVFERIPEDDLLETYPDDAFRTLDGLRKGEGGGFTADQTEHLLAKTLEHARRLRQDPRYRAEWVVRTNVRRHPLLSDRKFTVISRAPFLVFADLAVADVKEAARVGDALEGLAAEVHRLVAEPNGLPRVGEVLKVLILPEAEGKKLTGIPLPPGVAGYYSPRDRGLYLFAGRKGEDPDTVLRRLVHDATHQLMHALAKVGVEKKRGKPVEWTDPALRPRMLWLSEGFAELMAGAMLPGARGFDIDVPHLGRRAEWKNCREAKKDEWSFDVLIKVSTTRDMQRKAFDIGLNRMEVSRLSSLFYAQAWSFTFFLWHVEDGKYRDRLRVALAGEVTGGSGRSAWQEQWFGKDVREDWGPLEKEWRAWEEAQSEKD